MLERTRAADGRQALDMTVDEVLERIRRLAEFARWIGMPAR